MVGGVDSLTEREKETLRLLAASHDAKSAAAHLGLSVHTINERLRTARRKLGVSSSRAAARVLAEAEADDHQNLVDRDFGGAAAPTAVDNVPLAAHRSLSFQGRLIGGLVMSVIALTLVVALMGQIPTVPDDRPGPASADPDASPPASPLDAETVRTTVARPAESAAPAATPQAEGPRDAPQDAVAVAVAWLALVDEGDWDESWRTASSTFQRRMTQEAWAVAAAQLDRPAGPLVRVQHYAARSASSPGSDAGGSVLVQYQAASDTGARVLETVALIPDGEGWKVSAYFAHGSPGPAPRPAS